tara:strand:- start:236 stop:439 length:204 start_codon:yes stop_codon:yes gene_type:complete
LAVTSALGTVTTDAAANVQLVGVEIQSALGAVLVWGELNTDQTPNYATINDSQTPGYVEIIAGRDAA